MAEEQASVIIEKAVPKVERAELYVRVNPGDTCESIAEKYDTTVKAIAERNLINPDFLLVGHWLFV